MLPWVWGVFLFIFLECLVLLEKEGEVSSLLAFTLRQIIPFVSNLHYKDVLYFFLFSFPLSHVFLPSAKYGILKFSGLEK